MNLTQINRKKADLFYSGKSYSLQRKEQQYSIEQLVIGTMNTFNQILRSNVLESRLNKTEVEKRIRHKKQLRTALRECAYGDSKSKIFVKDYMKELFLNKFQITKETINQVLPFDQRNKLSAQDKFEIMLYSYKKEYGKWALDRWIQEWKLDLPKTNQAGQQYYEITKDEIEKLYESFCYIPLSFYDKLNIITQRVYQLYKGNGVIDEIRDMKIDGVSAGVSGYPEDFEREKESHVPSSYDSIWIFYHGKSIHCSFLSFGSYRELIRVCKNIYRYQNPGQLSEVKGYTINEMKDGSRVTVARPPFCESWVLFIRKFDSIVQDNIYELLTDKNADIAILLMKWLIKGEQVIAITGEQGSGKTTLLMSLIGFINPIYNLRIQELSFELHLRKLYPNRNIVTFRETSTITGQEALDMQKKTDGSVSILGEVASSSVAAWMISMAQVASLFTLFTHHAKTTQNLVDAMRNALLQEGIFQNEKIAQKQVIDCINFDIHMKKTSSGHRYIERITEIVPKELSVFEQVYQNKDHTVCQIENEHYVQVIQPRKVYQQYETRDIIVYKDGRYQWAEEISEHGKQMISSKLEENEKKEFDLFLQNKREKTKTE